MELAEAVSARLWHGSCCLAADRERGAAGQVYIVLEEGMRGSWLVILLGITVLPLGAAAQDRASRDYLGFLPTDALEKLYSTGEVSNIAGSIDREVLRHHVNDLRK